MTVGNAFVVRNNISGTRFRERILEAYWLCKRGRISDKAGVPTDTDWVCLDPTRVLTREELRWIAGMMVQGPDG